MSPHGNAGLTGWLGLCGAGLECHVFMRKEATETTSEQDELGRGNP